MVVAGAGLSRECAGAPQSPAGAAAVRAAATFHLEVLQIAQIADHAENEDYGPPDEAGLDSIV
jgi:hypothetical protein